MSSHFDLIVIGGGPAGVTAALRACELGSRVALVERGRLGGTCTNDGCVPSRVLAKTARLIREAGQFPAYGLMGEMPQLDFMRLLEKTQHVVNQIHEKKQLINHLEQAAVSVFAGSGEARFIDEYTVSLGDGRQLSAEKFILCTGGRARRLQFPGSEHALTFQDIWSLKSLPHSMAIVGGAAAGCQLASVFASFGTQVWVLEVNPRLLAREDSMVSEVVEEAFRQRGIEIFTGIDKLERIEAEEAGKRLTLYYSHKEQPHHLTLDAVIVASGWPGNADTLNLAAANVHHERGYVPVDEYLRSSVPHIFAAGDINGRMMLVQSAGYEARIAAENAVLGPVQRYNHQIVPHGGFTEPEYASVGMTEAEARAVESECVVAVVPYTHLDRAVIDGRTTGFCKLIVSSETHRILGAHIVGEQALEAVHLVAGGMAADMWIEQLAELELAYPTYTAIVGLAARRAVRELGVMPLIPEWQSLGKEHAEWERSVV